MASSTASLIAVIASGVPSKVPFYIAGIVLVVWAVVVALAGIRSPDFPGSRGGGRIVMAISGALVVAALATSIITAGTPAKSNEAKASTGQAPAGGGTSTAPTGGTSTGPASGTSTAPAGGTSAGPASGTSTAPASGGAPAAGPLAIAADPSGQLKFDKTSLSAKAGNVTVAFTNASPLPHNFTIQSNGKNVAASKTFANGKASVSAKLKPGAYVFLCTVPGHAQAGMKGTLTVK